MRKVAATAAALPSGVSEAQQCATEIVKTLVPLLKTAALDEGPQPDRGLFPSGVHLMSLSVSVGAAKIELQIGSEPRSGKPQPTIESPVPEPESCRDARLFAARDELKLREKVPAKSENAVCGAITKKIRRTDPEFKTMVSNTNAVIVFKDEEGTGADRMMSTRLSEKLDALAASVTAEWPGVRLRVTEAWDEDHEHTGNSLHYEGRAADLTTAPIDSRKLGRLGRLAVNAGCDWVWYENTAHVHVSVKK
jgi:hypothetical protein